MRAGGEGGLWKASYAAHVDLCATFKQALAHHVAGERERHGCARVLGQLAPVARRQLRSEPPDPSPHRGKGGLWKHREGRS